MSILPWALNSRCISCVELRPLARVGLRPQAYLCFSLTANVFGSVNDRVRIAGLLYDLFSNIVALHSLLPRGP